MNVPKDKAEGDKSEKPSLSRLEEFQRDGIEPVYPECDALYMVEYFFDVGPSLGDGPITHGEIESWQNNTGFELTSWEARTLRLLSSYYLAEQSKARNPARPSPIDGDEELQIAKKVTAEQNFRMIMSASVVKRS